MQDFWTINSSTRWIGRYDYDIYKKCVFTICTHFNIYILECWFHVHESWVLILKHLTNCTRNANMKSEFVSHWLGYLVPSKRIVESLSPQKGYSKSGWCSWNFFLNSFFSSGCRTSLSLLYGHPSRFNIKWYSPNPPSCPPSQMQAASLSCETSSLLMV